MTTPKVILFDEPTTFLDQTSIEELQDIISIIKDNRIIIIATHDILFDNLADHEITLRKVNDNISYA